VFIPRPTGTVLSGLNCSYSAILTPTRLRFFAPIVVALIALGLCATTAHAQAPFVTDDTEVADYHKFHFEFTNEFDFLKESDYPSLRQNTANFKFSYGIWHNVEIGGDNQLLNISSAPNPVYPDAVFGYGDLDFSVKWKICEEKGRRPSFGASLNIEVPTGDETKQLGSGITDYYLNFIGQKSLPKKNTLRVNGGIYFAGNPATGAVGDRITSGFVMTGDVSLIHDYTDKLALGVELAGAGTFNQLLGKGQLQTEIGGMYQMNKKSSFVFGFIAGFYRDSPRFAPIIGLEHDF